jgi:cystathionine beta-lyase family protein involved in aluminum resistance
MPVSPSTLKPSALLENAEKDLREVFERFDETAYANQARIMECFRSHRLSQEAFAEVTGYGWHDSARDLIDEIYAEVFETEAAAVRMLFVSGTHAISCAMAGVISPGQRTGNRMVCVTGKPYDTILKVVGLEGESDWSLKGLGVDYAVVDLIPHLKDETAARAMLEEAFKIPTCAVHIQRSRGYSVTQKPLSWQEIKWIIDLVKKINPQIKVFVDNCFSELVETHEPTFAGADIVAGSLIKNLGGGLNVSGGYIAGSRECVDRALDRLTAAGLGGHLGVMFNQSRLILQGLFLAPHVVSTSLKAAALFSYVFKELGFEVTPEPFDDRYDIVQTIKFENPEGLIDFCRNLQKYCPVDSHAMPEPALMPGYTDEIVMANGSFIGGANIELSVDGPLRPPYAAYLQGGLSYPHVRYALVGVLQDMVRS